MSNRLVPQATLIEEYLRVLSETPAALKRLAEPFDEDGLASSPDPKSWSAVDVLAHLRACSDVWTFSIMAMLAEDEPSLAFIDPRRWARVAGYAHLPFRPSLQAFGASRAGLLTALTDQTLETWGRRCTIGGRAHSVYSQVRRMAKHEKEHQVQIAQLLDSAD